MTTLADKAILFGDDNLDENRVTRPKKYSELSATEAIQADCDVKATNIILQGLPPEIYALVSNHKVAKEPWERILLLMQGTSLTKQEREWKQRVIVCYKCKGEGHMSKQCTKPTGKRDEAWFKDKVILVQDQANGQVLHKEELEFLADPCIAEAQSTHVNCTKINQDNKNVNEILTAELERYKDQVRILKEGNNVDKASDTCAHSLEIDNLKHTLSEHLKEKGSLEQMLEPKLYVGSVIQKTNAIVIRDSEETLMLEDESRSTMLQKQKDIMMSEKKVNTTPVDYAALNQLSQDFETRFVPQTELSAEQVFWSQNSGNYEEPNLSSRTTIVEVPKELPKVSMVNSSLKKLKFHLASFDVVVKERTTATAITEGTWGFEHTKACFRDEIIPFVKALKDLFNLFDQFLIDELTKVQNVFNQIEQAVEQHCVEKKNIQDKMKNVLKENERLLEQAISTDIVNIVTNANVNYACKTVNECQRCVTIETELQRDFIKKECYDKLFKQYTTLEKHCISLEVDTQLEKENFQRNNSFSQQSAPTFDQLFEINDLKAHGNLKEEKIKRELEEIETINIELDHRVTKLVTANEHLKQTYKKLYDSIKSSRVRSKE
nr:hypothetical protein [Tanacetum cinerariifolium]